MYNFDLKDNFREFFMNEILNKYFMREALKEALRAFSLNEVPVGAVLVYDNKIIARGHNQVELLKDPTAHAEMICLTAGSIHLNNWRLLNTTLYCTLEPCSMCAGALLLARVKKVVWAAPDIRVGANGSWVDLFEKNHPIHNIEVEKGLLEEESKDLLQSFFKKQRQEKSLINRSISS
jgi:tRNA(adenine34) deaminase